MASKRQTSQTKADRLADELIARLREVSGMVEIYSGYQRGRVLVTAFVDSEEAEIEAATIELEFAKRDPHFGTKVDLHLYSPTDEVRAEYRTQTPETLEWTRDERAVG